MSNTTFKAVAPTSTFTVLAQGLDPITVILFDLSESGRGSGKIVIECYGTAWAQFFGGAGDSFVDFLRNTSPEYLTDKLTSSTVRRATKREDAYVLRIATAVIEALKGGAAS